jgi:hypothetical protein
MPKAKVSMTVEASLLRQVDRLARGASRSEVFEDALTSWVPLIVRIDRLCREVLEAIQEVDD